MASPLESQLKNAIARGFKGRLLTGTLRRETPTGVNDFGDPAAPTVSTYSFEGMRSEYSAIYRARAGIPETDSNILIIAGSLSVTPTKDDKVLIRGQWFQIRAVMGDPAGASYQCQSFEIEDPT